MDTATVPMIPFRATDSDKIFYIPRYLMPADSLFDILVKERSTSLYAINRMDLDEVIIIECIEADLQIVYDYIVNKCVLLCVHFAKKCVNL